MQAVLNRLLGGLLTPVRAPDARRRAAAGGTSAGLPARIPTAIPTGMPTGIPVGERLAAVAVILVLVATILA